MWVTLAPSGEYNRTVHVRQRCGLTSNYFDHLFYLNAVDNYFVHVIQYDTTGAFSLWHSWACGCCQEVARPTRASQITFRYPGKSPYASTRFPSTSFTHCAPDSTELGQITQNKGHYAVQGHSRSPNLVPIESSYTTSY